MVSLLAARSVHFEYRAGERALAGVDLQLDAGELVCVLGPNGSGKSTLLKVLNGVLRPTAGAVELDGEPLGRLGARERARRIAAVPQVLAALPDVDVERFVLGGRYPHLGLWGRARAGDREAVRRALSETDAEHWSGRHLGELSGGQCQRVLMARALAQEAELLLFDEPTAALDPEHQVQIFALFRRLVRDGRAALVATHELHLAGRYADRIVLLDGGRVACVGAPDEVLRPERLAPVYGDQLHYGRGPGPAPGDSRPLVVPWPAP